MCDEPILSLFQPGEHGSTFGGNPLGTAVARAALRVLTEENMIENVAELGEYLMDRLSEIPQRHIKKVRGKGLMIGVGLKAEAGGARRFSVTLMKRAFSPKKPTRT